MNRFKISFLLMADNSDISKSLIENSQAAMIAAIEIHNKPVMAYRYSLCVLLVINAWELILKAYICDKMPQLKLVEENGYFMSFEKCLANVQNDLATSFLSCRDNINALYDWRNKVAHYNCAPLDEIVYSLLRANVLFFCDFLKHYFNTNLAAPDNFIILPLGFSESLGPLKILCDNSQDSHLPKEAQEFLKSITHSIRTLHEQGVEDSILAEYDVHLVNASRAKNADLIARIDNQNPDAATLHVEKTIPEFRLSTSLDVPEVRLPSQNERFKEFQMTYDDLVVKAKERYSDFKHGKQLNAIMNGLKEDPNCCQKSFLNPVAKIGAIKCFYGGHVWIEFDKIYTIRTAETENYLVQEPAQPQQEDSAADLSIGE